MTLEEIKSKLPQHIKDNNIIFILDPTGDNTKFVNFNTGYKLMQYDNGSRGLSIVIPRIIKGHDMSDCNTGSVHWRIKESKTGKNYSGAIALNNLSNNPTTDSIFEIISGSNSGDTIDDVLHTEFRFNKNVTQYAGTMVLTVYLNRDIKNQATGSWENIYSLPINTDSEDPITIVATIDASTVVDNEFKDVFLDIKNRFDDIESDIDEHISDFDEHIQEAKTTINTTIDSKFDDAKDEVIEEVTKNLEIESFASKDEVISMFDFDPDYYDPGLVALTPNDKYYVYTQVDEEVTAVSDNPVKSKAVFNKLKEEIDKIDIDKYATEEYVTKLIESIDVSSEIIGFEIVDEIPTDNISLKTLYIVRNDDSTLVYGVFKEPDTAGDKPIWTEVGNTKIDPTRFATDAEVKASLFSDLTNNDPDDGYVYMVKDIDETLKDYVKTEEIDDKLKDYAKTEEVTKVLEDYAKKEDLEDIDLTDYAKKEDLKDYVKTEDQINLQNGEGEASIKTPDVASQSEDVEGFPEGRLNKVTGSQAAALGAAHKVTKRGSVGLGAYANLRTRFSAGIGYVNNTAIGTDEDVEVGYGDGNVGIGDGNAITSKGGSVAIGTGNKIGYIIRLTKEEREKILANEVKNEGDNVIEVIGDLPNIDTFSKDILIVKDGKEYLKERTGFIGKNEYVFAVVGEVQEGCTKDIIGSRALVLVSSLPTSNIDFDALYLLPNGSKYDQYRYIDKTWKLVGTSTKNLRNVLKKVKPDPGYTHGGYREDTIYVRQISITPSGRSSYKLLTEQHMNPGQYYIPPNTTVSYVDENGTTKTYMAICKLCSKKADGKGEFIGAVALGYGSRVTNTGALATGAGTWADGFASFSAGEDTEAHGNRAFVTGYDNVVYSNNGFVAGTHHKVTGTGHEDITLFGRWSDAKEDLLFAVGNGTDDDNRKNVLEIYKDDTVKINGQDLKDIAGSGGGTKLYKHTFYTETEFGNRTLSFNIISTSNKPMKYEYIANKGDDEDDFNNEFTDANFGNISFNGEIINAYYESLAVDPGYGPSYYKVGYTADHHSYNSYGMIYERFGIETIGGIRIDSILGTMSESEYEYVVTEL